MDNKAWLEAYHQRVEDIAKARATAIQALTDTGLAQDEAKDILSEALEKEREIQVRPMGIEGESEIQKTDRAWAAMDTVVNLFTHDWPSADEEAPEPIDISLAQINCDRLIQIRVAGIDQERVNNYATRMKEGDKFPPIVVFFDRRDDADAWRLWLADGFHRYAAMLRTMDYTTATIVYAGTRRDAEEYAAICNAHHGLPLSNEDKWAASRRLLEFHPEWSNREIARRLGVSHPFVGKVRKTMEEEARASGNDFQMPEGRVVTRGDQTYEYKPPEPFPEDQGDVQGEATEPKLAERKQVQFEAEPKPPVDDAVPAPPEEVEPTSHAERIKNALVAGDWQELRTLVAGRPAGDFMNALQAVFAMGNYEDWRAATECLIAAFGLPAGEDSEGRPSLCPKCGGRVIDISTGGKPPRTVCMVCGTVVSGDGDGVSDGP
jgi:hypothetical protein